MERSMVGCERHRYSGCLILDKAIDYRDSHWHRVQKESYLKDSQSYDVDIHNGTLDELPDTINDIYGGVIASSELRAPSRGEWLAASKVSCDKNGNHVGGCWPDALGLFGMCDHEWAEYTSSIAGEFRGASSEKWCGGDYYGNRGGTGVRLVMDVPSAE